MNMRQPAFAPYSRGWNDAAMGRARRAHQPAEYYAGYAAARESRKVTA